jgi:hypothetical protein
VRLYFKNDEKGRKGQKARKVTERKMANMHLLETGTAIHKSDVKIDGKRNRKRRKKGGKSARRVKK